MPADSIATTPVRPSAPYPTSLEIDVSTAWGLMHLRAVRPDDAGALVAFHESLSPESQYLRFFSAHPHLSTAEAARFTNVDYTDRLALVIELDGVLIGIGRYDRLGGAPDAEVAFVVADGYQCHGLGTLLLRRLADAAAERGVVRFVAETLPGNHRMQAVFRESGFDAHGRFEDGVVHFVFPIHASAPIVDPPLRRMVVMPVRVFLLDDHELVRRGVRDLLWSEEDILVVGEASTAAEALERIPQTHPDVAVLDVRLGEDSTAAGGVEVCREIRSAHPEVACVMLTSFADDEALFAAILAGAAGYVLKQIRGGDLVTAIRRVAGGESLLDPAVTARVLDRLRRPQLEADPLAGLTPQERRILDLIAEGKTNRQIGDAMFLAEKTVKNYVSNLLAKLGMARRSEAAAYAARLAERRRAAGHPDR